MLCGTLNHELGTILLVESNAILIIDIDSERAGALKGMIEFLDTPNVKVAVPADWLTEAARQPLHAIFIGNGLSVKDADALCEDIEMRYPGVPVVVIEQG